MTLDTTSVDYINRAVTDSSVVNMNATGQAYQGVANSMALAVENTSSQLASFSTMVQAGMAKALEKYMETKDTQWAEVIGKLQLFLTTQAESLKTVGQDAGVVMAIFGSLTQQKFKDVLDYANNATPPKPISVSPEKVATPTVETPPVVPTVTTPAVTTPPIVNTPPSGDPT